MHRRRSLGVIGFRRRSFQKLIDDERREGEDFLALLWQSATWHLRKWGFRLSRGNQVLGVGGAQTPARENFARARAEALVRADHPPVEIRAVIGHRIGEASIGSR